MQALGLGRACSLGHFCRRRTASPSPRPPYAHGESKAKTGRVACAEAAVQPAQIMAGEQQETRVVTLLAVEATPESFAPFGQVIAATPDGDQFGPHDAQLDLSRGIPRFYIMKLENRPLKFSSITHHASVTQCLGAIGGQDWYLGVAKPSIVDGPPEQGDGRKPVQARAGHYYLPPDPAEICVFRVSGPKFLKLHKGTWHAGPLFKADAVDFYNLELSDTNAGELPCIDQKEGKLQDGGIAPPPRGGTRYKTTLNYTGTKVAPAASQRCSSSIRSCRDRRRGFSSERKMRLLRSIQRCQKVAEMIERTPLWVPDCRVVDHTTHYFKKHDGITFVIED